MNVVAVTQRVDVIAGRGERRDALDQRWAAFLQECGLVAQPVPNHPDRAAELLAHVPVCGLLLTGGNTLQAYGGDAPERDATEDRLLRMARAINQPVIGVCRGMQLIQHRHGVRLGPVHGHVTAAHSIIAEGRDIVVNSYHDFGATETVPELAVLARASDGVVESIRHATDRLLGLMWHPERYEQFRPEDVKLFKDWFMPA